MSYAEHLAVAMCSLFETNGDLRFDVYIVNSDIDRKTWDKIAMLAERYGHKLIDVRISDQALTGVVLGHHFSKANYYRLFIPEELGAAKALYLDSDIVVNGSIKELYEVILDDCYLAAVINPGFDRHEELEMSKESKYFNSGVMLLNLTKWRQDGVKARVIELVKRKPDAIQYVDQCGINSVVDGRWVEIHPKFNVQSSFFGAGAELYAQLFKSGELAEALRNPVIIHYTGTSKPWQFRNAHRYRSLYWKYLRMTPFRHYVSKDLNIPHVVRWCIHRLGKHGR